ncbi:MAG: hypothetical protein AAF722_10800, partial [Cyanobacteria bacterium P01_C01_bin.70]
MSKCIALAAALSDNQKAAENEEQQHLCHDRIFSTVALGPKLSLISCLNISRVILNKEIFLQILGITRYYCQQGVTVE